MISVHTTVPDDETADAIARELVEERVAACVNKYPVSSTYRWEGEVVENDEVALGIKTSLSYDEVRERVEAVHPYDVPMVLRYDAEANDAYADWVRDATRTED
ncbi:MAG: divalent-cation tolerance protein CutA [Halobacteriales archaeon]